MIPSRIRAAAVIFLVLAGCGDRAPKPPDMAEVFPNLPLPPAGRLVSSSGGADAVQLTMTSSHSSEQVATYYRSVFSKKPWRLVNQAKGPGGSLVLLAEQNGHPLWVSIRPAGDATRIELSGAVVAGQDSGKTTSKPAS